MNIKTANSINENGLIRPVFTRALNSSSFSTFSKSDIYFNNWRVVPGTEPGQRWLIFS